MNRYKILFDDYVRELRAAHEFVTRWWSNLLAEAARSTATPELAEQEVRLRWPLGPTTHPRVIAVVRKYYIACERLNMTLETEKQGSVADTTAAAENDWGSESEEEAAMGEEHDDYWDEECEIDPPAFLYDVLYGREDELAEFMAYLVFSPIGDENGLSV
jgi:hypothetical protein